MNFCFSTKTLMMNYYWDYDDDDDDDSCQGLNESTRM